MPVIRKWYSGHLQRDLGGYLFPSLLGQGQRSSAKACSRWREKRAESSHAYLCCEDFFTSFVFGLGPGTSQPLLEALLLKNILGLQLKCKAHFKKLNQNNYNLQLEHAVVVAVTSILVVVVDVVAAAGVGHVVAADVVVYHVVFVGVGFVLHLNKLSIRIDIQFNTTLIHNLNILWHQMICVDLKVGELLCNNVT